MESIDENTTKKNNNIKRTNGVADYFTVLGVGEKLVWKHTQKNNNGIETATSAITNQEDEEEDEALLVERFYREIVDVSIFIVSADESDQNRSDNRSPVIEAVNNSNFIGQSYSYATDDGTSLPSLSQLNQNNATNTLSPQSHSGAAEATVQEGNAPVLSPGRNEKYIADGYTIVKQTCPACRGYTTDPANSPTSTNETIWSGSSTNSNVVNQATAEKPWSKSQILDANLDPSSGLGRDFAAAVHLKDLEAKVKTGGGGTNLRGISRKVGLTLRNMVEDSFKGKCPQYRSNSKFYLGYRRRSPDDTQQPAIANLSLSYVRIHTSTVTLRSMTHQSCNDADSLTTVSDDQSRQSRGTSTLNHLIEKYREVTKSPNALRQDVSTNKEGAFDYVPLEDLLQIPEGFHEISIPEEYKILKLPKPSGLNPSSLSQTDMFASQNIRRTFLIPHDNDERTTSSSGAGVEAYHYEPEQQPLDPKDYLPKSFGRAPSLYEVDNDLSYKYIPILFIKRQRVGDEERYNEDPGVVDIAVSFFDNFGDVVMPDDTIGGDIDIFEEEDEGTFSLDGKTNWSRACIDYNSTASDFKEQPYRSAVPHQYFGAPAILIRRNVAIGFADAPFATSVLDRFPLKNYKGLPLPEEELPMFCYPTGCRLHRAKFCDAPLPEYYGFVVKNERGDSIYVSCVSFMEPLTLSKISQLNKMSQKRQQTSIPHRLFCEKKSRKANYTSGGRADNSSLHVPDLKSNFIAEESRMKAGKGVSGSELSDDEISGRENSVLTGFDDMTTFENKTICLISRYPFWTAFRRFLSHLHILSGSSSELPLERWISHLLLTVPVPKPGGQRIVVPLPTLQASSPMVLEMPPSKDLPLVDLPYNILFACLDVPTIVLVVLSFLALERKVIVMSSRPSLVLDACELLRSLLFPFDLCAPYVPRLTQPFMSCLDFPGAIFVGIHDDKSSDGLAAIVRKSMPEDSIIVDLDTGRIECSGDRHEVLKQCWNTIPKGPRTNLISEVEKLCHDASVAPGLEPLDSQIDPAFDAALPSSPLVEDFERRHNMQEPLDDRAIRDAFLRFFCFALGGYERYLVVPDANYLISGNEWFDSQAFLSSVSQDRAPFLGSLVTTQLFQSFIQRRTEASDVQCMLFDECLVEYHSSPVPYGRLGGDVETIISPEEGQPRIIYSLLVDQCAAETYQHEAFDDLDRSGEGLCIGSDSDVSTINQSFSFVAENDDFIVNKSGDIVTIPSRHNLTAGSRFFYCVDGNPCFPQRFKYDMFSPREPDSLLVELSELPEPLLARSEREVEEAYRKRKYATVYRGLQNQRRCLWQLPKLMGSEFLGAWLMCIPSQVSQPNLSPSLSQVYLLRALGALRLLRYRQRIIPDEAAYRALMVACGRAASDRRVELVKLFGLLRSDGIFPSALTLGQYTRAIAEGFSKRSTGIPDDAHSDVGGVVIGRAKNGNVFGLLDSLDGHLAALEDSGKRWRQRDGTSNKGLKGMTAGGVTNTDSANVGAEGEAAQTIKPRKRNYNKSWLPIVSSSSFVPPPDDNEKEAVVNTNDIQLIAIWSRTTMCESCSYIPLDEEIQSGWDVPGELEVPGAICCPRCSSFIIPRLGFRGMTISEALQIKGSHKPPSNASKAKNNQSETEQSLFETSTDFSKLPPQLRPYIDDEGCDSQVSYVTYISPATMRSSLERHVEERGESVLERETLRDLDPETFINLWWYCCRFSLNLPLPLRVFQGKSLSPADQPKHCCAIAAWDRSVAELGCQSAAESITGVIGASDRKRRLKVDPDLVTAQEEDVGVQFFDDFPLLARFNLQELSQSDWEHPALEEVLSKLIEASDKRDFKPVVECLVHCNNKRRETFNPNQLKSATQQNTSYNSDNNSTILRSSTDGKGNGSTFSLSIELDCYRTMIYLAKYQCTSVFHAFIPTALKPCKGYHFWCPSSSELIIFDGLFRDALKRMRHKSNNFTPIHDVSDVALGFRCVFGHLI